MISAAPDALPDPAELSFPALNRLLKRVSRAVGITGEVDVLLTTDTEVRRLNRQFRGKNKATDVLSFPAEAIPGVPAKDLHAGDIAISINTATRQAAEHGHTLDTEVRVLLLHGLLHLVGMDHETDGGEMRERELALKNELRLPAPLIERALSSSADPVRNGRDGARKRAPARSAFRGERSR